MASFLSRSTSNRETKNRRRSESVTALSRVKENRRQPLLENEDGHDVATRICVEISRAMLLRPNLNLGVFLKTSANSRRDLNQSDASVLITVAILDHIGNPEMAKKLLDKSSTLTSYYSKMNLTNKDVREMFVTVIFALSPEFVDMVETSVTIAISKSARKALTPTSEAPKLNAMVHLANTGSISSTELESAWNNSNSVEDKTSFDYKSNSIQTTPTDMIKPSDSASLSGSPTGHTRYITDKDMYEYIDRKKTGKEPDFKEVFPRAIKPITITKNLFRHGIGYKNDTDIKTDPVNKINQLLGSHTVKSVNFNTGSVSNRRPRVEDYLVSEAIGNSVLESPPDVKSDITHGYNFEKIRQPVPTETYLPDSVYNYDSVNKPVRVVTQKDSLEELMARLSSS